MFPFNNKAGHRNPALCLRLKVSPPRQLGIPRFSELYVRRLLSAGRYDGIPLEVNAYALGRRFEAAPRQQFAVADEVASWVREDRF